MTGGALKLSIVVPAHNEANRMVGMLDPYLAFFIPRYGDGIEFIVVVNGSTDKTESIANCYARRYPQVRVIVEPKRIGKGGALIRGFRAAGGELVGFADADGATPPEAFEDLVENIGDAGAVIASRWLPGSQVLVRQSLKRRIASRGFNSLVRLFFGLRISDTQCGAKLLTQEALEKVLPQLGLTQWAFDVDLLFQVHRAGYRIAERASVWSDQSGSQIRVGRASLQMFVAICRLRLLFSPFRWVVSLYDHTLGKVIRRERMD